MDVIPGTIGRSANELGRWSWLILCAVLPISGGFVPVPLFVSIVLVVVLAFKQRPSINWLSLWPVFLYYFLHVLGMAWSSDIDFGLFDLQIKLGLVLVPFAALVLRAVYPDILRHSMVAFTGGTLVAMVLGIVRAWGCYQADSDLNCFSQSTVSFDLHPSYAAWYGCWVIAYWGNELIKDQVAQLWLRASLVVTLPLVLAFIMLLASKSGVIGLVVLINYLLISVLMRFSGKRLWVALATALAVIAFSVATQGPLVKARMAAALDAVSTFQRDPGEVNNSSEGSALRLITWTCSVDRLHIEPFGAGTGDIKHALMECYMAKGATEAASRNLNSHSQFLQSAVALGWPGLASIFLLALVPLWSAWKHRVAPAALFMLLFVVNAAVESVLEVQAGVVFFALFLGLLVHDRSLQTRTNA